MDILTLPQGSEENENGIVVVIRDGDYECVITGDIPGASEKLIVGMLPDAESYIVGHHGSKTSNSMELLRAADPDIVIISCGENNEYKHPDAEVVENFNAIGAEQLITYKEGTIVFVTDGDTLTKK